MQVIFEEDHGGMGYIKLHMREFYLYQNLIQSYSILRKEVLSDSTKTWNFVQTLTWRCQRSQIPNFYFNLELYKLKSKTFLEPN